mgnify:CR=1 FL=1
MENKEIDQMMNWHSVDTELPKADLDQPRFSVDVLLTDCQSSIVSYYDFKLKEWHNYHDLEHDPSHWMYINMPQQ